MVGNQTNSGFSNEPQVRSRRGGWRPGAGRPRKAERRQRQTGDTPQRRADRIGVRLAAAIGFDDATIAALLGTSHDKLVANFADDLACGRAAGRAKKGENHD